MRAELRNFNYEGLLLEVALVLINHRIQAEEKQETSKY